MYSTVLINGLHAHCLMRGAANKVSNDVSSVKVRFNDKLMWAHYIVMLAGIFSSDCYSILSETG